MHYQDETGLLMCPLGHVDVARSIVVVTDLNEHQIALDEFDLG